MSRKLTRFALCAAFGAAVVALSVESASSADEKKSDKVPPIKEIMKGAHGGDDAHVARIVAAVKGGKWEDAQKSSKALAEEGAVLGKNTPKRGDAKSWETLAKKYAETTKAVHEATDKKDKDATGAALDTLRASCKECHMSHKGKAK